ncbi:MAG TPA: hypothetical protein DEO84_09645 [candidate division Zixibacteria bacterium]|nr:hypothetical protein [candidate division Zixibacteria bacterium]HBZ01567.1 hypothetical protein [candidate division Zixibacteria bacterium]
MEVGLGLLVHWPSLTRFFLYLRVIEPYIFLWHIKIGICDKEKASLRPLGHVLIGPQKQATLF